MRILIACERSGVVRSALRLRGHDAWSCDLCPADDRGPHIQGDVLPILADGWDLLIAHPPCTHLCVSGARWFPAKCASGVQSKAAVFFMAMFNAPVPRVAVENPIGIMSTLFRKPDCIVQPWHFGDGYVKATCWWLRGLPPLQPTDVVPGRVPACHRCPPGPDRPRLRSQTYPGMAAAIASQWA